MCTDNTLNTHIVFVWVSSIRLAVMLFLKMTLQMTISHWAVKDVCQINHEISGPDHGLVSSLCLNTTFCS